MDDEPPFAWWTPYVRKKRDAITKKVCYVQVLSEDPQIWSESSKTIEEAKRIDHKNKDTLWQDAVGEEMRNNRVASERWLFHAAITL